MVKLDIVFVVLQNEQGDILFVRENTRTYRDKLTIPGGKLEPKEGPENTAIRELIEETARNTFSIDAAFYVDGFNRTTGDRVFCYIVKAGIHHKEPMINPDTRERLWLSKVEFEKRVVAGEVRDPELLSFIVNGVYGGMFENPVFPIPTVQYNGNGNYRKPGEVREMVEAHHDYIRRLPKTPTPCEWIGRLSRVLRS